MRFSDIYDRNPDETPDEESVESGDSNEVSPQELPEEPDTLTEMEPTAISEAERKVLTELTEIDGIIEEDIRQKETDRTEQPPEPEPSVERPSEMEQSADAAAPTADELTEEELRIREEAISESERIAREELRNMFPETEQPVEEFDETPEADTTAPGPGRMEKLVEGMLEVLGLPARWLGPTVLTGLGLAGIFLLIALLVVILVQAVLG